MFSEREYLRRRAAKILFIVLMLMGRLEIMTVLVLFTRSFWKEN